MYNCFDSNVQVMMNKNLLLQMQHANSIEQQIEEDYWTECKVSNFTLIIRGNILLASPKYTQLSPRLSNANSNDNLSKGYNYVYVFYMYYGQKAAAII